MGVNLSGRTPATPGGGNIIQQIFDGIAAAGGVGPALVGFIGGLVGELSSAVKSLLGGVAGLFGDTGASIREVDVKRRDGEQVIATSMSQALDKLDESVRTGGAAMLPTAWRASQGDNRPHVVPLTDSFPVQVGTRFVPPPLSVITDGYSFGEINSAGLADGGAFDTLVGGPIAKNSGYLELLEGGFWLVFFQTAVRSFNGWSGNGAGPMRSWAYITPATSPWLPAGPPTDTVATYHRTTGAFSRQSSSGLIAAYGRTTVLGSTDIPEGGFTALGLMPCLLPSGGYKVSLATQNDWHYGGLASTYVWAFKVNTETLRADIDALKAALVANLPTAAATVLLTDQKINAEIRNKLSTLDVTGGMVGP